MLRRPPTVLTLTSEDVKAYEDHREAEAFQHATAAAQLRRQQQLSRNMSGMDITGITTSSDDEDYSEQEASYYPNRTYSQNPRISRENIQGPLDDGIYRNEEDPDDYEDASDGGLAQEEAFIEDHHMAEAGQMDLDAEQTDSDGDSDVPSAAVPNLHHTREQQQQQQQQQHHQQQQPMFPSPPPAPPRLTRSTRSASTEPSSSQAQNQQQHQQPAHAGRLPRGAAAAQTHRRAPSGRAAATDATTPTPAAQAQRDAAERVRSRTTRSRDERIGVARGGRR